MLENAIVEAVLSILGIVLTGVFGFVGNAAAKFIKSHHAEKLALQAVRYAEETFKEFGGRTKFNEAAKWLVKECEKVGIKKLTDDDIKVLVQSAYKKMKDEIEQVARNQEPEPAEATDTDGGNSGAVEPQPEQAPSNDQAYRQALADKVKENQKTVGDMTMDDLKIAIADVINKQQAVPQPQQPQNVPLPK